MLLGARALVKLQLMEVSEDPEEVVREFRARFYDTQLFFDKYAGGKFAHYLFRRHGRPPARLTPDAGRQAVEEAQLFLDAAHACRTRLGSPAGTPAGGVPLAPSAAPPVIRA
jgi:sulfite reductase (ferredoxin)